MGVTSGCVGPCEVTVLAAIMERFVDSSLAAPTCSICAFPQIGGPSIDPNIQYLLL